MMKHTLLYIGMALAFFAMQPDAAQAKTKKPAKVEKQLVVLHTNDTHSCVMPVNPNLADTAMANRGGFLRRVAMIQEERKENPDLLLFDSGDFSQGSPYYSLFKGDVEVGLMNEMKYDAATIGIMNLISVSTTWCVSLKWRSFRLFAVTTILRALLLLTL